MVCLEGGVAAVVSSAFRPEAYSLMRGVSVSHLLADAGKVFRVRADALPASDQAKLHDRSALVRGYHRFLSHCWGSPGRHKFYALASDHLGPPAFVASGVVAVAVHVVQNFYALPAVATNDVYNGNRFNVSCWEQVLGEAAALCVAFAGRHCCTMQYFLDCVCIHQTNLELKKAGVAHIPEFVRSSQELFVLWDEQYLTRLWCVYEVAVAHAVGARTAIRIMPLGMSVTLVQFHALIVATELVQRVMTALVPMAVVRAPFMLLLWGCCFALVARASADLARMLRALVDEFSFFQVQSTQIFSEADRRLLYDSIEEMYGSLDAFDIQVRTRVRQAIMEGFALQRALLPYRALMVPLISQIPNVMGACSGEIGKPAPVRTVIFISCITDSFAVVPVCIALAMSLGSAVGRSGCPGSWALFLAIGVVVSMVHGMGGGLTVGMPKAVAHGSYPLGLELEPWHAVPCALVAALPWCVAAVWLFRPTPAAPPGAAAARARQGAVELTAAPEVRPW